MIIPAVQSERCYGAKHHATLVFGGFHADPDHDAVMRIGGEAPRRQAHSLKSKTAKLNYCGGVLVKQVGGLSLLSISQRERVLMFKEYGALRPMREEAQKSSCGHLLVAYVDPTTFAGRPRDAGGIK
jgi:hypothetical protein